MQNPFGNLLTTPWYTINCLNIGSKFLVRSPDHPMRGGREAKAAGSRGRGATAAGIRGRGLGAKAAATRHIGEAKAIAAEELG